MATPLHDTYSTVKYGKPHFISTLAPVLTHTFSSSPPWVQGIVARDTLLGTKEYLGINHFEDFIDIDVTIDHHLYEVVADGRPVRPYFDLEWDSHGNEETVLMEALGVIALALQNLGIQGGGISIYCASGPCKKMPSGRKASYHVLCYTDKVFRSTVEHRAFISHMMADVYGDSRFTYVNAKGVATCLFDTTPYSRNQAFRLPYQSKIGTDRPLLPYYIQGAGFVDAELRCIGIYEDPATLQYIEVPRSCSVPRNGVPRSHGELKYGVESAEYAKVVALSALLTVEFMAGYQTAMDVIYCLWTVEQSPRMHNTIHIVCGRAQNYEKGWVDGIIQSWQFGGFTIGSLVRWATVCSGGSDAVHSILKQYTVHYKQELFDNCMIPTRHTTVSQRYLEEPYGDDSTILVKSHLGTGKTVWITGLLRERVYGRILIISPRKSYTFAQHGLFMGDKTLPVMASYLDHRGPLAGFDHLIIQVESLHRIGDRFMRYDLVILDEVESILNQLHSVKTNAGNLITNHEVLGLVVSTAGRVIMADAFLSDRAFHFSAALRATTTATHYIENTFQPYNRTAILLSPVGKDVRVANVAGLCERMCTALRAGKRIVVIWTSKKRGESFVREYLDAMPEVSWAFYNSDSSKEEQAGLQNVRETWSTVQCLMMTTSITVGISYDPRMAELEFDEAFLYGSSASAMPRDIAQALLRVRTLKANRLTYVVDTRVRYGGVRGFQAIYAALGAKEDALLRNHPLVKWTTCPEWVRWNHAYNENEERNSRAEYKAVLDKYLINCGYTLVEERHVPDEAIRESVVATDDMLEWDSIDDITGSIAADIYDAMKRGEATVDNVLCYKKFMFREQFISAGAEEVRRWWVHFYEREFERRFWNVVHEKRQSLTDMVRDEAAKRYGVMATGCIKERETIGRFLAIMGMQHSQEAIVVTAERLEEVGGVLCSAEKGLREGMGMRPSRRREGGWNVANSIDLIKGVLEKWGCGVVETVVTRFRINKKQTYKYSLKINENNTIWNNIRGFNINYDENMIVF